MSIHNLSQNDNYIITSVFIVYNNSCLYLIAHFHVKGMLSGENVHFCLSDRKTTLPPVPDIEFINITEHTKNLDSFCDRS